MRIRSRHIGFTGTRQGMTQYQIDALSILFTQMREVYDGTITLHHGDCTGADAQACKLAQATDFRLVSHPPIDPKFRFHYPSNETREPKDYIARNHDIVKGSHLLIAAPYEMKDVLRSGTWATIRFARKEKLPITMLLPREVKRCGSKTT